MFCRPIEVVGQCRGRLEFVPEQGLSEGMTQTPDLRSEPLRAIYGLMTDVLEEAGEAQGRGEVAKATDLCEHAYTLGKTIAILAGRASPGADGGS